MIPKIIHYCWFGGKQHPNSVIKCIKSWRKYMPDYEIKEWNEDNFDVKFNKYTTEAYEAGKFAFVSDVARFYILYQEGGIYLDTDVEIIKPLDHIIQKGGFMGIEIPSDGKSLPLINPGLGLCAPIGHQVLKSVIDYYNTLSYINPLTGEKYEGTVVTHTTKVLSNLGLQPTNNIQNICGINIYPKDFFNPLDDATGKLNTTDNTHTIHWYSKTWIDQSSLYTRLSRMLHRIIGVDASQKLKRWLRL